MAPWLGSRTRHKCEFTTDSPQRQMRCPNWTNSVLYAMIFRHRVGSREAARTDDSQSYRPIPAINSLQEEHKV